jgi:hypothetical protein
MFTYLGAGSRTVAASGAGSGAVTLVRLRSFPAGLLRDPSHAANERLLVLPRPLCGWADSMPATGDRVTSAGTLRTGPAIPIYLMVRKDPEFIKNGRISA